MHFFNYPRLILNTKENNYQLFLTENRVKRIEIDVWKRLEYNIIKVKDLINLIKES